MDGINKFEINENDLIDSLTSRIRVIPPDDPTERQQLILSLINELAYLDDEGRIQIDKVTQEMYDRDVAGKSPSSYVWQLVGKYVVVEYFADTDETKLKKKWREGWSARAEYEEHNETDDRFP